MKEMQTMNETKQDTVVIDTKEDLDNCTVDLTDYQERMLVESIKRLKNPFYNISVKQVAEDLQIGENMAYEVFKRDDFPSINIGRKWKICLISYILWKTKRRI